MAKREHKHQWTPCTVHKAQCAGCGRRVPWVDMLEQAERRRIDQSLNYATVLLDLSIRARNAMATMNAPR